MNVFDRYAPFIQDYIYRSGWQALRGVQNAAGQAIFGTDGNVLLTASTASGKTEAAFFPILTLLDEEPSRSVGVLYIAPLKALINDQFGTPAGMGMPLSPKSAGSCAGPPAFCRSRRNRWNR